MVAWLEVVAESIEVDRFNYTLEVELLGRLDIGLKEEERIQGDSWVSDWNNLVTSSAIYKVGKVGEEIDEGRYVMELCFKC